MEWVYWFKRKKVITIWSIMSMHNQYFMCESEIYVGSLTHVLSG